MPPKKKITPEPKAEGAVRVRALKDGFDATLQRRRKDEAFDWPADLPLGRWVERLTED